VNSAAEQILVCLITAQLAGDFLLQTAGMVRNKHHLPVLLGHTAILAGLSYLLCGLWTRWEIPAVVMVSHTLIDAVKVRSGKGGPGAFLIDQAAHLAVIGALTAMIVRSGDAWPPWSDLIGPVYLKALIMIAGATASIKAGGFLIGLAVRPIQQQLLESHEEAGRDAGGFERGGMIIGELERALIFLMMLIGQAGGIGFLIAAKSILRFGEAQDPRHRKEAEYIIIGTLMSFGWGILIGYLTLVSLQQVP
jgi:hypothetical protein